MANPNHDDHGRFADGPEGAHAHVPAHPLRRFHRDRAARDALNKNVSAAGSHAYFAAAKLKAAALNEQDRVAIRAKQARSAARKAKGR